MSPAHVQGGAAAGDGPPSRTLVRLSGITKAFAGVQALRSVDLEIRAGEVHALVGENGAGKSTLMKVLFGVVRPDAGTAWLDGAGEVHITDPRRALALGIELVSQELSLVPQLDVAQNVFLGQSPALSLVRRRELRARAAEILRPLAPHLPVDTRVSSLGMAERQVVEIARALARGGRIIAFDEPTSSLTPLEREGLFTIIRGLRDSGRGVIYISHHLSEVYTICDRVTVLRDGAVVASLRSSEITEDELIGHVAGRKLVAARGRGSARAAQGEALLELDRVCTTSKLREVSLRVRAGEIFGLAGLVGSGRTELARCIFGADPISAGAIKVGGRLVHLRGPADGKAAGVALIPEDRRGQSLVPLMDVTQNFGLASYRAYSWRGLLRLRQRRADAQKYVTELTIRPRNPAARMRGLSGGNQQKVVIARWLRSGARVFVFDEPTRGIDVGAKAEIHELMRRLADRGCAVVMISSELAELLAVADRIGIMRDGRLVGALENGAQVTEDQLLKQAGGES